jgi:hypothetical protein
MNGFEALFAGRLWAWVVHPGLLAGGALLAAVPIAIHWWSRRRVRTIDWAAMRLLAGAWRREERRTRIEDRALLALRVLAVLAAAVVVARPLWSAFPAAADASGSNRAVRAARAEREWIVLLDDSLSMKTIGASGSAFELAKRRLRELIEARAAAGQDTLTLLVATAPTMPRWERVPLAAARVDELLAAVDRLACTDAAVDWSATLPAFRRWLDARPATRRAVLVCSDFRERDWNAVTASDNAENNAADNAADNVEKDATNESVQETTPNAGDDAANASWWLCDVGDAAIGNLTVAGLGTVGPVAAGVPFDYVVAVRNTGERPAAAVRVQVSAANTAVQEKTIESLAAGETQTVSFPLLLGEASVAPRREELTVEIVTDSPETHNRLAADDAAMDVLSPVPAVEIAIVSNAAPDHVPFIDNALAPAGPFATGFAVRRFTPTELTAEKLDATRVLVWEEIDELPFSWLERLEAWVGGGGSLVLIPGPNTDPQDWRTRLWRDGAGLAPAGLRAIDGAVDNASWRTWGNVSPSFNAGRILDRADNPLIDGVKIFRWWDVESPAANVLARLASPADSPVILEHAFGAGRVALLTVPLRTGWTDWPLDPSFVIFWQEWTQSLAAERMLPERTLAGAPIRVALPSRRYQATAWLRTPAKTREPLVGATADQTVDQTVDPTVNQSVNQTVRQRAARLELASAPLLYAGPHVLELTDAAGRRVEHPFSVLVDPREGELQRVSTAWRPSGTLAHARRIAPDTPWTELLDSPREWWWWAAFGLAGILAAEQTLAWNLGRRR